MAKTKTEVEASNMVAPMVNLMPKYELEEACFRSVIVKDVHTGKQIKWPRPKPTAQIAYEQNFLDKVLDRKSGEYHPKRDEEGKPVDTTPNNVKHVINTIIRIRRNDNTEFLYSKGNFIGYDALGDEIRHYASMPEKWLKTNFVYEKDWDPKSRSIVKNCQGPGITEDVYMLEFNEANLKSLFDKRENDHIMWVVKDEPSGTPRQVAPESNINDTFKLFLKPFSYLYNSEYISPQQKAEQRRYAEDQGLITRHSNATEYKQERVADELESKKKGMYV